MSYKLLTLAKVIFSETYNNNIKIREMKRMIYLMSLLIAGVSFAQQTQSNNDQNREENNMQNERPSYYDVRDTAEYTSENQRYIFTRDNGDIQVHRSLPDGQEEDFGRMRRTTLDGFYVITSTATDEVSFGSFDEEGNLQTYRYDPETDTIVPQEFISPDPIEKNMRKSEMRSNRQQMRQNGEKVRQSTRRQNNNSGNNG